MISRIPAIFPVLSSTPPRVCVPVDSRDTLKGLGFMVLSSVLFAGMGSFVYAVQLREPNASVLVSSFVRIVVNIVLLVGTALCLRDVKNLIGDRRPSLWLRGLFGALALICSFASIKAIGIGESSFLYASNGVFVALLGPIFLGQKNSPRVWIAIIGAIVGLFLLFEPRLDDAMPFGRGLALVAGFLAALSYLMIARVGKSNTPSSVIFYFCIIAFAIHGLAFAIFDIQWPKDSLSYVMLIGAGVFGSLAQLYLTRAYQLAPAALNAAVSYALPILNLGIGIFVFAKIPDGTAWLGAGIVLVFGVMLPFVRLPQKKTPVVLKTTGAP